MRGRGLTSGAIREPAGEASRDSQVKESTTPAQPILVIGRYRSGTKWLSNILLNHSELAGVQTERHCGIVEAGIFGGVSRLLKDLRPRESYIGFIVLWSESDFFRASGVDRELFLAGWKRPGTTYEAFGTLMEEVARRSEKRFWLQKIPPNHAEDFLEVLPDARLVLIHRRLEAQVESSLARQPEGGPGLLIRLAFGHAADSRILNRLGHQHPGAVIVRYEDLARDTEEEVRRICGELDLGFEPGMTDVRFRRNTSFKRGRRRTLRRPEVLLARAVSRLARLMPLRTLLWLRRTGDRAAPISRGTYAVLARLYPNPTSDRGPQLPD